MLAMSNISSFEVSFTGIVSLRVDWPTLNHHLKWLWNNGVTLESLCVVVVLEGRRLMPSVS
jgi:hypothetical protein